MARSKAIRVTAGRRSFLLGSAAMLAGLGAGRGARAANDESTPFDFGVLTQRAKRLSEAPYKAPAPAEGLPEGLTPGSTFPGDVFYRETDEGLCVIDIAWSTLVTEG